MRVWEWGIGCVEVWASGWGLGSWPALCWVLSSRCGPFLWVLCNHLNRPDGELAASKSFLSHQHWSYWDCGYRSPSKAGRRWVYEKSDHTERQSTKTRKGTDWSPSFQSAPGPERLTYSAGYWTVTWLCMHMSTYNYHQKNQQLVLCPRHKAYLQGTNNFIKAHKMTWKKKNRDLLVSVTCLSSIDFFFSCELITW